MPALDHVVAVVVTHRPDVTVTAELLHALTPQVAGTVVVDNGSPEETVRRLREVCRSTGARLEALSENVGIATAQNVGIALAREAGADAVLLSDQDSLPSPDMVSRLVDGYHRASAGDRRVAAVGPVTHDERQPGAPLLFSDRRWGPRRARLPRPDGELVEATFLLASGCLIPTDVLDTVGGMNDAWFIDHIDLEWGLRARRAGLVMLGVGGAVLRHHLGDSTLHLPGRERHVHIHSPTRNYYMARNTVLLVRSGLLPAAWRLGYLAWITK